jgi:hypothetical protein
MMNREQYVPWSVTSDLNFEGSYVVRQLYFYFLIINVSGLEVKVTNDVAKVKVKLSEKPGPFREDRTKDKWNGRIRKHQ